MILIIRILLVLTGSHAISSVFFWSTTSVHSLLRNAGIVDEYSKLVEDRGILVEEIIFSIYCFVNELVLIVLCFGRINFKHFPLSLFNL